MESIIRMMNSQDMMLKLGPGYKPKKISTNFIENLKIF